MTDDELDQESRARLRRFLGESTSHPAPAGLEDWLAPPRRRRRFGARGIGAVVVFVVVAAVTAAILVVATAGSGAHRHTVVQRTPSPSPVAPSPVFGPTADQVGAGIERLTGGGWALVQPPTAPPAKSGPGASMPVLQAIACPAPGDCWAVGEVNAHGLIDHLAGGSWSVAAQPSSVLDVISCASSTDCWAVGGSAANQSTAAFEHYDGRVWSAAVGPPQGEILSMTCPTSNECWAVGATSPNSTALEPVLEPLLERYDGTGWTVVTGPPGPTGSGPDEIDLRAVTCASSDDCWAVGSDSSTSSGLIWHYDGTAWVVAFGSTSLSRFSLESVSCSGPDECWAVGNGVVHYDGTGWSVLSAPSWPVTGPPALVAVTCAGPNDCWAVGSVDNSGAAAEETLVEQWQGSEWTSVVSTPPTGVQLNGVACSAPDDCWAVGDATNVSASGSPLSSTSPPSPGSGGGGSNISPATPIPGCDSAYQDDLAAVAPSPLPAAEYTQLDHGLLFSYGYGSGPVYLTGQLVWYGSGDETAIMVDPSVRDPVTVSFTGPTGSSATFEGEQTVTIAPTANGWAFVEGRLMPTAAGCWTMQATYGSSTERVAFTVAPGSPPPG